MYLSKERLMELAKSHIIITTDEVSEAFALVQEVLEHEADALRDAEPQATVSIDRLEAASREVMDIYYDIANENFDEHQSAG